MVIFLMIILMFAGGDQVTLRVRNAKTNLRYLSIADVDKTEHGYLLRKARLDSKCWLDFDNCRLNEEYVGSCKDEGGREWWIEGGK